MNATTPATNTQNFRYLRVHDDGQSTFANGKRAYHGSFTNKAIGKHTNFQDFEFLSAEDIGQMMGGN